MLLQSGGMRTQRIGWQQEQINILRTFSKSCQGCSSSKLGPQNGGEPIDSSPNKDIIACALAFRPRFLRFQQPIQFQSVSAHRSVYPD